MLKPQFRALAVEFIWRGISKEFNYPQLHFSQGQDLDEYMQAIKYHSTTHSFKKYF